MYHPFLVSVLDNITKKTILNIPCAEEDTANLVQKNLQSLFPTAEVLLKAEEEEKTKEFSKKARMTIVSDGFDELEKELFNDVA